MKKLLIVVVIFVFAAVASIAWWENMLKSPDPNNNTPVIFVVNRGDGVREISHNLKSEGLIKDPTAFFLLIKQLGLDKEIQAGDFRLDPSMNAREVAQNLTTGRLDIWVTIPEGKRAEEVAEILKNNIPSYQESWISKLKENEGYLFPDTYLIPRDASIEQIAAIMLDNFNKKFASIEKGQTNALSKNDAVTVASLVEREAKYPQDRPLVASVIINRLDIGMKLDIDATVQYALGFQKEQNSWWKKNLSLDDLKINSLYNTYINPGLPPSPIANPGIEALRATIAPENTEYLYYISDNTGRNHYGRTLAEHQQNIEIYLTN